MLRRGRDALEAEYLEGGRLATGDNKSKKACANQRVANMQVVAKAN